MRHLLDLSHSTRGLTVFCRGFEVRRHGASWRPLSSWSKQVSEIGVGIYHYGNCLFSGLVLVLRASLFKCIICPLITPPIKWLPFCCFRCSHFPALVSEYCLCTDGPDRVRPRRPIVSISRNASLNS